MKNLLRFALVAALATPALAADTVVTTTKHTDASKDMMGQEVPAQDSTQVMWIGKDRMRIEEGDEVTIVRADLKKMFLVRTKDKTYSAIDLPFDMKKYMPPDMAPMMEAMFSQMKVTVTPTTETKKIKDWNATKYTMTMSLPMGGSVTSDIWATKDVKLEAGYADLMGSKISLLPGGAAMAAELKKIEGIQIQSVQTMTMMGQVQKSTEEVAKIETKDAPEGAYDIPKDFKETPFDPMSEGAGPMGPPRGRGMGGPGRPGGGHPPVDKPKVPVPEPK